LNGNAISVPGYAKEFNFLRKIQFAGSRLNTVNIV